MKNFITHYAFHDLITIDRNFFTNFFSTGETTTFGKILNKIDVLAETEHDKYGYSVGIHYTTTEEAINKFKGDLFEVFMEIFIKINALGNVLDITDYQNTKKDYPGVDSVGLVQGKKVAIQIKFLSDPRNFVDKDDMMNFYAVATGDLGITQNESNLILLTSSFEGIDYSKMNAIFRNILQKNIRIINNAIFAHYIDNNHEVINRVISIIESSISNNDKIKDNLQVSFNKEVEILEMISQLKDLPSKNSPYKQYKLPPQVTSKKDNEGDYIFKPGRNVYNVSQMEAYERMQSSDKLSVILPTGTGKGHLLFVDLLSRIYYKSGKVFTICSHRIGLNKQHTMDMFDKFKSFIGDIGYIFVASETYLESDEKQKKYRALLQIASENSGKKVDLNSLISTLKPGQSLQEVIDYHTNNNRSVVIVSTYHSLQKLHEVDIDVIYCDEADKMVGTKAKNKNCIKEETFMQKFHKVRAKKKYFFTATPKDWTKNWGGENIEFMNNESIFGERIEMEFHAAIKSGYIVQPYIHIVYPLEYDVAEDIDCEDEENLDGIVEETGAPEVRNMNVNLKAKIKMIVEAFNTHRKFLKDRSGHPDKIGAKMLIKCKNIKTELWGIFHDGLREALPDIKMFAGGSYGYEASNNNDYKNNDHYMYDPTSSDNPLQPMNGRDAYLAKIKSLKLEEDAIVLHCDILSEGINVKGFTNVMFVSGVTQTDAKALQNIGRATRIVDEDRERLETGEISLDDMSNWVKPFCSVTIPFWNEESAEAKEKMVVLITQLREVGFQIEKFGTGTDINKNDKIDPELDPQNEPKLSKRKSGIRELEQELEELAHLQRVANLHPVDYIFEMGS
jgi:hypothetical protein